MLRKKDWLHTQQGRFHYQDWDEKTFIYLSKEAIMKGAMLPIFMQHGFLITVDSLKGLHEVLNNVSYLFSNKRVSFQIVLTLRSLMLNLGDEQLKHLEELLLEFNQKDHQVKRIKNKIWKWKENRSKGSFSFRVRQRNIYHQLIKKKQSYQLEKNQKIADFAKKITFNQSSFFSHFF